MPIRSIAASLTFCLTVSAQAAGAYWGANLGFADLDSADPDCPVCEVDPSIGGKLVVGYNVWPYYFAVESGYAYLTGKGDRVDLQQQSVYLAGVFSYPLSNRYLLSLKIGPSYNRGKAETTSGTRRTVKGDWADDLYYGVGLSVWIDRHAAVRLEYERFSEDDGRDLFDADLLSIGFVHRF